MFRLIDANSVIAVHDAIIEPQELQGLAKDKSIEGALARVENRVAYEMVADVYELAALYAMAISQAHAFNDANKRTAYEIMVLALALNGIDFTPVLPDVGDKIIDLAQGKIDAEDMAAWLRTQPALTSDQEGHM